MTVTPPSTGAQRAVGVGAHVEGPPGPGGLLVDGFLPKPYAPEHLGAAVREALDSKR